MNNFNVQELSTLIHTFGVQLHLRHPSHGGEVYNKNHLLFQVLMKIPSFYCISAIPNPTLGVLVFSFSGGSPIYFAISIVDCEP
jgi:hypothetical protein